MINRGYRLTKNFFILGYVIKSVPYEKGNEEAIY